MTGWHNGPLAAFDVESTGVDTETARIVTASILQRGPQDSDQHWLVNPGIDIPAEATEIHGITTEHAKANGLLPWIAVTQITDELHRIFSAGIPLVIYNASYDCTVLDRETRRHALQPFADVLTEAGGLVIDPLVLDKALDRYRRGKRTLTANCEHYGVKLDAAHDSTADALGAMRVAWKIAVAYPEIAEMAPAELRDFQAKAKADQAASFQDYLRSQGKDEVIDGSWPLCMIKEAAA